MKANKLFLKKVLVQKKRIYWIVTIPFLIWMLASAFGFLIPWQEILDSTDGTGFHPTILKIIGAVKILGVIAILQTSFIALKNWAFAGFAIDLIGASGAMMFSSDKTIHIVLPILILILVVSSYNYWKMIGKMNIEFTS